MIDYGIIAIILSVVLHSGALFYWGGKISKSVSILEKLVSDLDVRVREVELTSTANRAIMDHETS